MCRGITSADELTTLISRADVVALGPGLGQDEWAQTMFKTVLANDRPAAKQAYEEFLASWKDADPVLLATPYWMLRHLGLETGGSQYAELRESLLRLALTSYQNDAFFNPETHEHEYAEVVTRCERVENHAWRLLRPGTRRVPAGQLFHDSRTPCGDPRAEREGGQSPHA